MGGGGGAILNVNNFCLFHFFDCLSVSNFYLVCDLYMCRFELVSYIIFYVTPMLNK